MSELTIDVFEDVIFKVNQKIETTTGMSLCVPQIDLLALPQQMDELPTWLQIPLHRFLKLKQRNWPAKTVQRSTRQLFNRMNKMITFFVRNYEWSTWQQLSPNWIEDYIDASLREGKAPGTINWDLNHLRSFCQFLIDDGYPVPVLFLKLSCLINLVAYPVPCPENRFFHWRRASKMRSAKLRMSVI